MITSFQGEHRFLSNFWPSPIIFGWKEFQTVEHAYQASKALFEVDAESIRLAESPGKAKRMSRTITIRSDWNEIKEDVMRQCVHLKFQIPELKELLLKTGEQELIEGNTWNDKFWGAINVNGRWVGQNKLGKILMEVRNEIRIEKK